MRVRGLAPLCLLAAATAVGGEKREAKTATPRRLFLARCSTCHDPGRVNHRNANRDEWREIVYRMQRMPQSGITPKDAETIIGYLVSLRGRPPRTPRTPAPGGGRTAYGKEWLSILEVATVVRDTVRLGGKTYQVERDGASAVLRLGRKTHVVALDEKGRPAKTARIDSWKVGEYRYELHLVLYEARADRLRIARALRRIP